MILFHQLCFSSNKKKVLFARLCKYKGDLNARKPIGGDLNARNPTKHISNGAVGSIDSPDILNGAACDYFEKNARFYLCQIKIIYTVHLSVLFATLRFSTSSRSFFLIRIESFI